MQQTTARNTRNHREPLPGRRDRKNFIQGQGKQTKKLSNISRGTGNNAYFGVEIITKMHGNGKPTYKKIKKQIIKTGIQVAIVHHINVIVRSEVCPKDRDNFYEAL